MRLRLLVHLDSVLAEEALLEGRGSDLSATALRDLVLLATGSPRAARKAFHTRAEQDLEAGRTPG